MNPQDQSTYNPNQRVSNKLEVMQPGERKICSIKRHPIGIIGIYAISGIMLIVIAVLAFGVFPSIVSSDQSNNAMAVGAVVLLVSVVFAALYSLIATKVYWGNNWEITSDSITQINQTSLFNRQSSQLSLANIEDVTAEQNGLLTHMFNYGVVKVETAGEHSKFQFLYCPNPNYYATQIISAREAFEQRTEHGASGVNVNTDS